MVKAQHQGVTPKDNTKGDHQGIASRDNTRRARERSRNAGGKDASEKEQGM